MTKEKITRSLVYSSYPEKLRILLWWLFLATAAIFIHFGTMAYAADTPETGNGDQEPSLAVKNWKGDYIGKSHHVVMDPTSGRIVFVIVSLEQEDNTIKDVAVPWDLFSIDAENGILLLSSSREKLDAAPEYHSSDLEDPRFIARTYKFFALAPPWKRNNSQGKPMGL